MSGTPVRPDRLARVYCKSLGKGLWGWSIRAKLLANKRGNLCKDCLQLTVSMKRLAARSLTATDVNANRPHLEFAYDADEVLLRADQKAWEAGAHRAEAL